jgi:queuine tRNA-ribosyltransferase
VLGLRLSVMHNLWFYNNLMREIREAIENGTFASYYEENVAKLGRRI